MPNNRRAQGLDQMLTGLALYEAYITGDSQTLESLTSQIPPHEAVACLLRALEVTNGVFSGQLGLPPGEVINQIRRRVIREIATAKQ